MIEHRWVTTEGSTEPPTLQFRLSLAIDVDGGLHKGAPSEWQDVPTVVLPAEPDESELLREAREIVADIYDQDANQPVAGHVRAGAYGNTSNAGQAVRAVMAALRKGR